MYTEDYIILILWALIVVITTPYLLAAVEFLQRRVAERASSCLCVARCSGRWSSLARCWLGPGASPLWPVDRPPCSRRTACGRGCAVHTTYWWSPDEAGWDEYDHGNLCTSKNLLYGIQYGWKFLAGSKIFANFATCTLARNYIQNFVSSMVKFCPSKISRLYR